eukprot:6722639-Pyramimonas_sp.AAC.1
MSVWTASSNGAYPTLDHPASLHHPTALGRRWIVQRRIIRRHEVRSGTAEPLVRVDACGRPRTGLGLDTNTVELTIQTLLSHLITGEFNSPADSLQTLYVRVEPYTWRPGTPSSSTLGDEGWRSPI